MFEVLDKNIITRVFTPKTPDQRLIEWDYKMTVRDPLRVIANEARSLGLAIKAIWRVRWSNARSISSKYSAHVGSSDSGA